jgi:hypothetical protein
MAARGGSFKLAPFSDGRKAKAMPQQETRVALLNLAHRHRCPRRSAGAAARVLGVFPTLEDLRAHAGEYYGGEELDLIAVPLRKWIAVLRHTQGEVRELDHLTKLSKDYRERERRHEEEFRSNVSERRTGDVTVDAAETERRPPLENDVVGMQEAPAVPRAAELRTQSVAVISILPDLEEEREELQQPALLIWDVFDSDAAAREAIMKALAVVARDVHLDVVLMYEWVPLTGLDLRQIKEEFRDESLTSIMQARKDEGSKVEQYRLLCEQRGQEPNVLTLTRNHEEVSPPPPLERQTPLVNLCEVAYPDSATCEEAPLSDS